MKKSLVTFIVAMVLAAGSVKAADSPATADTLRQQLIDAAAAAGLDLRTDEIGTLAENGVSVAAGTFVGFEQVPSTALADGVNFGYAYFDIPGSDIPAGTYLLRAHANAEDIKLGGYSGTVDLISSDGAVVTTLGSAMSSSSLTVPEPLPFPHTTVSVSYMMRPNPPSGHWGYMYIVFACPNGEVTVLMVPTWIP